MGITVTGDRQAGLSDKEVLTIMRDSPEVRAAVAKIEAEREEGLTRQRLDTLDQLDIIAADKKRIEADVDKLRPKLETARRNYEMLSAQNAELHQRLNAVAGRESEVGGALIALGECAIWDNVNKIQACLENWHAELRMLERKLAGFKWDHFDRRYYPSGREEVVARIEAIKTKIALAPKLQKQISGLAMARIGPRELVAKVDTIMAQLEDRHE